jgi:hypothetical protein
MKSVIIEGFTKPHKFGSQGTQKTVRSRQSPQFMSSLSISKCRSFHFESMFVLTLITQLASRKIAGSTDPCAIDFWRDYFEGSCCLGTRHEAKYEYAGFSYKCILTTTSADLNWSMECQTTSERCSSQFSPSWFMNGPNDESAVCEGVCVYNVHIGLLFFWLELSTVVSLFIPWGLLVLALWLRDRCTACMARRVANMPAGNGVDPNNIEYFDEFPKPQAAQGATCEL